MDEKGHSHPQLNFVAIMWWHYNDLYIVRAAISLIQTSVRPGCNVLILVDHSNTCISTYPTSVSWLPAIISYTLHVIFALCRFIWSSTLSLNWRATYNRVTFITSETLSWNDTYTCKLIMYQWTSADISGTVS